MSATKAMRRWVGTATKADLACRRDSLEALLDTEKNMARRSSYREQLDIISHEQERRWHEAEAESYNPTKEMKA